MSTAWVWIVDGLEAHGEAVIASATVLLVVATVILAWYTSRLWKATKELAEDAQRTAMRQAAEMKESLRIASESATAAALQAKTAERSFFATHRPKLVVRRVDYAGSLSGVLVEYSVHNVGDSVGTIISVSEMVWLPKAADNLPARPRYGATAVKDITLESGDSITFQYLTPLELQKDLALKLRFGGGMPGMAGAEKPNASPILFFGHIDYVDHAGTKRQTAFLRTFNFETERFDPISHPDYEYQD